MTAYYWNDPARTLPRRRLADRIRHEVGPETDSWDLPEPTIGGNGRELKPCGTWAAYLRHNDHGEKPCRACREACRERSRARKTNIRKSADVIADRLEALAQMDVWTGCGKPPRGVLTADQAGEQLGVNGRTITRYLRKLREQEQEEMAS